MAVPGCRGKVRKLSLPSSAAGSSSSLQPSATSVVSSSCRPCNRTLVTAHYICYLGTNMKQIDSSRERGRPLQVVLGDRAVVQGLEAALRSMTAGERSRVWMAGSYGDGRKGVKGEVPPNCPIVMDVEVLGWEAAAAAIGGVDT